MRSSRRSAPSAANSTFDRFRDVTEVPGGVVRDAALAQAANRYALAASRAAGRDVLEVACGAGLGLRLLAQGAHRLTAGDIAWPNVRDAVSHGARVDLVQLHAEDLPFGRASFDVV